MLMPPDSLAGASASEFEPSKSSSKIKTAFAISAKLLPDQRFTALLEFIISDHVENKLSGNWCGFDCEGPATCHVCQLACALVDFPGSLG